MKTISAVLLAGGSSARHGRNKLTLPLGDSTVIQQCVDAFAALHLSEILVVTGFYHDDITVLPFGSNVRIVHNDAHALGMSSTVRCGLSSLTQKVKGVFVCPADMPMIRSTTLVQIIHKWNPDSAVIPRYGGRKGHPVLLSWNMARWCVDNEEDRILPRVLETFKTSVVEVDVDDEGVVIDLDRPKDYETCVARWNHLNGKSGL